MTTIFMEASHDSHDRWRLIIYLIGVIALLIDEFKEHILWGILGIITQISNIIFAIIHFDKCKKSLGLIVLGIVLMILGGMLGI